MCNVQAYYRKLHRIPEQSGHEYLTSKFISQVLSGIGYEPRQAGETSIYVDLVTDPLLPWILLRADMDALPIEEKSNVQFLSEQPGWMHACGHDAHCAMLMDAAGQLYGKRLPHNVRFLFQSAEETTQGAAEAISSGVLPKNLLACFAIHVWPGIPEGTVATRYGALMASSDVYRIKIHGRSAHCAQSHNGADALQTAVYIAAKLPEIRESAANKNTVLFCGSIHSGNSHNIVPDEANLWGTLRTFSDQDRENIKSRLEAVTRAAAEKYGTDAILAWDGGCPAISNSAELILELQKLIPNVCDTAQPTLAAEDFALYQKFAPGVMLWLGIGDTPPLHNSAFYVPENILPIGTSMWVEIASHDWKGVLHYERA